MPALKRQAVIGCAAKGAGKAFPLRYSETTGSEGRARFLRPACSRRRQRLVARFCCRKGTQLQP